MKKGFLVFLGVAAVLILIIIIGRNVVVKTAVERVTRQVTGLDLEIGSMDIGLAGTDLRLERVRLMNPPDFPDAAMLQVPEFYVDYNLGAVLQKKIHLPKLVLNVEEFLLVRNKGGELNINALKTVRKAEGEEPRRPTGEAEFPEMNIEELHLKIGKVIYKDYSAGGPPRVQEFNINIDEKYQNITDPRALVNLIVLKALTKTTLSSLTDVRFLQNTLQNTVTGAVGTVTGLTGGTLEKTGEVIQGTTEGIKKLLPFGGEQKK